MVNVDEILFSNAINNIIGNAIKFTPNNGRIEVKAVKSGSIKILSVIDNGLGTNEADLLNKEMMDFKVSVGTNGETGTGMGMKIIKKICDSHGFESYYESSVGKGTTFYILMKD